MRYVDEQERAARRLTFDWFNEALFIIPGLSAWILGSRAVFDSALGFGYPVQLSTAQEWTLAVSMMLAGIGGATLRAARLLQPLTLAQKVRMREMGAEETSLRISEQEIRSAQFSVHEVLDLPAVGFLAYGVIFNSDVALVLSIAYSLIAFILARPDDRRLVRETMLSLRETREHTGPNA